MMLQTVASFPPTFNIERFMADFCAHTDRPDAMALERHRDAQGEDDAEIAHSAFACLDVECRRERCVALQERILALRPDPYTICHIRHCTVSKLAMLDCGACAT